VRWLAVAFGALYIACVWLDGAGTGLPDKLLPLPARTFIQVSQLFPHAAKDAIEWHAKAWRCDGGGFQELDLAPDFPIHAGDKENRFDRAMFFYLRNHKVLSAIDEYLVRAEHDAGRPAIGGVMLLSVRIPIPPPGTDEERYHFKPANDYPPSERRYWYVTPSEIRDERCAEQR
jgi:hypothetical protein